MAGTGQGYDLSTNTYSPDGRVFQIDYAQKCIHNAPTVIGLVCKDGVIFGAQKILLSKMLVHGTNKRSYALHKNAGCTLTGLIPDGRCVVEHARGEASNYLSAYGEKIPGRNLAEKVSNYMHLHTLYGSVRPIGTGILIGSYTPPSEYARKSADEQGELSLFSIEPDGFAQKWFGKALGKGRQLANTEIEKLDLSTLTVKEALFNVARILHKIHDETKAFELEAHWICKESKYVFSPIPKDLVKDAEDRAKKAIEDEDEE